jgi:hypothetical protein
MGGHRTVFLKDILATGNDILAFSAPPSTAILQSTFLAELDSQKYLELAGAHRDDEYEKYTAVIKKEALIPYEIFEQVILQSRA